MKMKTMFSSLACGAVLLAGLPACTADQGGGKKPVGAIGEDPVALVEKGVEEGQAGDIEKAKQTFEQVLAVDENNMLAWYNLGYIAQSQDRIAQAIDSYDQALEADPFYKPALFNKAIALESHDRSSAIDLYRQIVELDGEASTAYLRLGLLLVSEGDEVEAREAFGEAVRLDGALLEGVPEEYRDDADEATRVSE
ncbi:MULTISPECIES: tetratricopeptide repeat protein [unclassified Solwaraspora]|uniref:tetratricopeptide repeat protein n=1 Tax=unclassified Solwaraspora TaxID=2627926 RepID=UPI00248C068D|nr:MULTISPECIES: tetratricopeptide repeat protein [unclassified Solwaraspora]WBB98253.1 tetratricopeptide repeat protein [Solwaraspora sp. WMMA2059]WBC23193.1 tetratricopeptide repeat protein [Solwaraspora sp. WMMA2080]WJK34733.1 tetratricopeptide repeat protein [Solwaraspora sp. WMMA2065]